MADVLNISHLLAIAGIVIGCITTFYIAYRQGTFRKAYLIVSCGIHHESDKTLNWEKKHIVRGKKPLWAIFFGMPKISVDTYLVFVPFLIRNPSTIAIKNIHVQFNVREAFDFTRIKGVYDDNTSEHVPGITGIRSQVTTIHGKYMLDIAIPVLGPHSHATLYFPIAIDKQLFLGKKSIFATQVLNDCASNEFIVEEINCYFSAENIKANAFKTHLLVALLRKKENLQKKTDTPRLNLHEQDCPNPFKGKSGLGFKPMPWSLWYWFLYPSCRRKKTFILSEPSFNTIKSNQKVLLQDLNIVNYIWGLCVFDQ